MLHSSFLGQVPAASPASYRFEDREPRRRTRFLSCAVERLRARDFLQAPGNFLKLSIAPCAGGWWRDQAESFR
jgi:hypothetical protein